MALSASLWIVTKILNGKIKYDVLFITLCEFHKKNMIKFNMNMAEHVYMKYVCCLVRQDSSLTEWHFKCPSLQSNGSRELQLSNVPAARVVHALDTATDYIQVLFSRRWLSSPSLRFSKPHWTRLCCSLNRSVLKTY